jgi:hypothetical protein
MVAWIYLIGSVIFLGWLVMEHYGRYFPDVAARLPVFGLLSLQEQVYCAWHTHTELA